MLMSTRARARLHQPQQDVRSTGKARNRLMRLLSSGHHAMVGDAYRELWNEFRLSDREYRQAVIELAAFCEKHHAECAELRTDLQ